MSTPYRPRFGAIDVHHHFGNDDLVDYIRTYDTARVLPPIAWRVEDALADMDAAGIVTSILSQFVPYDMGTDESRRELARSLNRTAAELALQHPTRFAFLATLPLPSVRDAVAEARRALDDLGALGVAIVTSAGGRWPGDEAYEPLFAELDRRRAVCFIHPWTPSCCTNLVPQIPEYIIEYGTDTSRAIGSLLWSSTTLKFPNVRFMFCHCGGTMPFLIERFLAGTAEEIVPGIITKGKSPPFVPEQPRTGLLTEIRKMHFDTAQCSNPVALDALRKVVPVSQILYGSDYWYRTNVETMRGLLESRIFSNSELDAIRVTNAAGLFGIEQRAMP